MPPKEVGDLRRMQTKEIAPRKRKKMKRGAKRCKPKKRKSPTPRGAPGEATIAAEDQAVEEDEEQEEEHLPLPLSAKDVLPTNPLLQPVNGTNGVTTVPGEGTPTLNATENQKKLAEEELDKGIHTRSAKWEPLQRKTQNQRVKAHNNDALQPLIMRIKLRSSREDIQGKKVSMVPKWRIKAQPK